MSWILINNVVINNEFQIKYGYNVYAARHCHDILAPYFKNLSLPIAEDNLCGLEEIQYKFRYLTRNNSNTATVVLFLILLNDIMYFAVSFIVHWYRKYEYEYKINRLQAMIEKVVGHPVSLGRAPNGALQISPELLKELPNIEQ